MRAIFAAGCFWGVEAEFKKLQGVSNTEVGYSGGSTSNPNYEDVCKGTTGHAEVVAVDYDPSIISYDSLLKTFWQIHDPTQLNRQGVDVGTQYRSEVYYLDGEQQQAAQKSLTAQQEKLSQAIVTKITPAATFFRAEEYHQDYFTKNPGTGCRLN